MSVKSLLTPTKRASAEKKPRSEDNVVEALYLYAKLIFGRPPIGLRVNFFTLHSLCQYSRVLGYFWLSRLKPKK